MQKKKIEVIVYYQNMVEPFLQALKTNSIFANPTEENNPGEISKRMSLCRAYYELENFDLIVRCLEDIMPPFCENVVQSSEKNSQFQYELLVGYLKNDAPDLVISTNSAGSTTKLEEKANGGTVNGCVYVGGQYFMFDAKKYDKTSVSNLVPYVFSNSKIDEAFFDVFSEEEKIQIASHFMTPPNKPANPLTFNLNKDYICDSLANVMDDAVFDIVDPIMLKQTENMFGEKKEIVSCDTIHGVVKMAAIKAEEELNKEIKTIFIATVEDRFEKFIEDVDPEGKQEYAVSYNKGIAVSAILEKLDFNIKNSNISYF